METGNIYTAAVQKEQFTATMWGEKAPHRGLKHTGHTHTTYRPHGWGTDPTTGTGHQQLTSPAPVWGSKYFPTYKTMSKKHHERTHPGLRGQGVTYCPRSIPNRAKQGGEKPKHESRPISGLVLLLGKGEGRFKNIKSTCYQKAS